MHNCRLEPRFLNVINVMRWKIGGSPETGELYFYHRDLKNNSDSEALLHNISQALFLKVSLVFNKG